MGKAIYPLYISSARIVADSNYKAEDRVNKEIEFLLNILPEGTNLISIERKTSNPISAPFEIVFEHPIFEDGTTIETTWSRAAWNENDKLRQVVVFTGIKYINPDGTIKYI